MEKRKITKFSPLCPSDISPYKGATKQKIPPVRWGCAFTLVELIVVITILAILGTIAFISLQNYARDARDVKRASEIKQLFTKIEIEHTKGVSYADLINVLDPDTDCHTGNVLGQNAKICQGPANFGAINENQDSFKDGKNDYIFAYTEPVMVQGGDGTSRNVEFLQGAITLENGTNKVVGNYYTKNEDDTSGLVLDTDGEPITDGGNGNVSTPPENTDEENPPTTYNNCTAPQTIGSYTITENKNHNETLTATRTGALSGGGKLGYSRFQKGFTCNNGSFEASSAETERCPVCDTNAYISGISGNYTCKIEGTWEGKEDNRWSGSWKYSGSGTFEVHIDKYYISSNDDPNGVLSAYLSNNKDHSFDIGEVVTGEEVVLEKAFSANSVQVGTGTAEIPKFNIGWSTTGWTTVASGAGFTPSLAASSYGVESGTYDYNMKVSQGVSSCIE